MDTAESEASLAILRAIARADGSIDAVEARALVILAGGAEGGDDERVDLERVDLEREASRIRSDEARRTTFEAAVALASIDGRCAPEEHALLERLRRAFGIEQESVLVSAEAAWLERLRGPRSEISAADVDFLHAIASANREGAISTEHYAALVDELRSRRARILEGALSPIVGDQPD